MLAYLKFDIPRSPWEYELIFIQNHAEFNQIAGPAVWDKGPGWAVQDQGKRLDFSPKRQRRRAGAPVRRRRSAAAQRAHVSCPVSSRAPRASVQSARFQPLHWRRARLLITPALPERPPLRMHPVVAGLARTPCERRRFAKRFANAAPLSLAAHTISVPSLYTVTESTEGIYYCWNYKIKKKIVFV